MWWFIRHNQVPLYLRIPVALVQNKANAYRLVAQASRLRLEIGQFSHYQLVNQPGGLADGSRWSFRAKGGTTTGKPRQMVAHPGGVPEPQTHDRGNANLEQPMRQGWHPCRGARPFLPRCPEVAAPNKPPATSGYPLATLRVNRSRLFNIHWQAGRLRLEFGHSTTTGHRPLPSVLCPLLPSRFSLSPCIGPQNLSLEPLASSAGKVCHMLPQATIRLPRVRRFQARLEAQGCPSRPA